MIFSCEPALNINIDNVNIKKNSVEKEKGIVLRFAEIFGRIVA